MYVQFVKYVYTGPSSRRAWVTTFEFQRAIAHVGPNFRNTDLRTICTELDCGLLYWASVIECISTALVTYCSVMPGDMIYILVRPAKLRCALGP